MQNPRGVFWLSTGVRHLLPLGESASAEDPVEGGTGQVPTEPEEIADYGVCRQEALRLTGRLESPRLIIALSDRFMRNLDSIFRVLLRNVRD